MWESSKHAEIVRGFWPQTQGCKTKTLRNVIKEGSRSRTRIWIGQKPWRMSRAQPWATQLICKVRNMRTKQKQLWHGSGKPGEAAMLVEGKAEIWPALPTGVTSEWPLLRVLIRHQLVTLAHSHPSPTTVVNFLKWLLKLCVASLLLPSSSGHCTDQSCEVRLPLSPSLALLPLSPQLSASLEFYFHLFTLGSFPHL